MTAAQVAYWDQVFSRMTGAGDWKKDLMKNYWGDNYLNSSRTRSYLDDEYRDFKAILGELGLAK